MERRCTRHTQNLPSITKVLFMILLEAEHNKKKFIIEEDLPEVGFYFYVYEDDQCVKDELQNRISTCKKVAFENYGVPYNRWRIKKELKKNDLSNDQSALLILDVSHSP